ncbi:uncharacterized protein LOC110107252 [Dendrobium catenatum]|uniref:uncharacterized protein LOC110107252 n=1 Tax=Dendrobium catenatum TaxID=906689 RepID=UPI0009F656AF|nr:uncharacterized protein LOC110107252 [Dendrobium catenatum]
MLILLIQSNDPILKFHLLIHLQIVDELRSDLWATSWELQELRNNVGEELRKKDEQINHLIRLLNAAIQERDEARDQLQMLLAYQRQPETPLLMPAKCSSSFTDSESLSDIQNQHSYALSPVINSAAGDGDSITIAGIKSSNLYIDESKKSEMNISVPSIRCKYDVVESKLDQLMKKPLPEQGKLLEAVMAAGPLLCTLMVVGDLPQWRNPPSLKPFRSCFNGC